MKTNILHKNYISFIVLLAAFLFSLSVAFYYIENTSVDISSRFLVYRFFRGIICFVYLFIILLFQKKESNTLILIFLALYGASSLMTVWYEINFIAIVAMGLNTLSFFVLFRALLPKIRHIKKDSFLLLSIVIMLVINGLLAYKFIEMFMDMTLSTVHFIFILLSSLGIVFLSFLAIIYNHKYSSKGTLFFLGFIILLLFSEVIRGIAYYNMAEGDFAAFLARALLIISLSLLVHFTFLTKKDDELLNSHLF